MSDTTVRAKMVCNHVGQYSDGSATIYMSAVYSADPDSENKKFSDATPNANFNITVKAGGPIDFFKAGTEYYVDLSPATTTT